MSNKVREISSQAKFNQIFTNVSRLLGVIGFDVLDPDFGPNWKMIYPCTIIFCAMLQILYLLWINRSDMVQFLVIVPYAMYEIKLVDIMVQLLLEYVSLLEDTFNGMALVRIGTIVLGTIAAIITFFETGDPMTFVFIPVLFVQLSQCCLLGTIIPVKNEELIEHLYDIKWYLLPEGHAKHVSLMLHQAQNAPTLTIGKYAPLNVESYEQILNSIYSFVTFLITFTG